MLSPTRTAFRVAQRLRRSRSHALLHDIESVPRRSREEVQALQFERLSALLVHAERHVPYYRDVFRSLGITSRDIRSLEDFSRLPVLTKDIVREHRQSLVREDVPLNTLSEHHSGGSTGIPLTFYCDAAYIDASTAGTYRNLRQVGWQLGDMIAFFWGWDDRMHRMSRGEFELRQWLRRMYQFDPFRSGPADMDGWIRVFRRLNARVALGYASTIARFAEHLERAGQAVPRLLGVFTTAETLYAQQRAVISRVFGCPVFDCYGSSEVQNIATECDHGRMHVNADYVVLETEDSDAMARADPPLIVTSLLNHGMPFIRYRNEDCGLLLEGECECGRGFPLMDLRIGRVYDNFLLPGGRVVHGGYFAYLLFGSEGIANFQFHQTAVDKIVLWITPTPGAAEARHHAIRSVVDRIRILAEPEISVEVREVARIPLSAAGKHRFARSDVELPSEPRELG